jgi:hypothetical protein
MKFAELLLSAISALVTIAKYVLKFLAYLGKLRTEPATA